MIADTLQRGMTPREAARYLRISKDRLIALIRRGELGALNTAAAQCGKPRFIILPQHLAEFAAARQVSPPPKPQRRKKHTQTVDYYPD